MCINCTYILFYNSNLSEQTKLTISSATEMPHTRIQITSDHFCEITLFLWYYWNWRNWKKTRTLELFISFSHAKNVSFLGKEPLINGANRSIITSRDYISEVFYLFNYKPFLICNSFFCCCCFYVCVCLRSGHSGCKHW